MKKIHIQLFTVFLATAITTLWAQEGDRKFLDDFRGTASITHNGISLVPTFSLGDPALLFDLKFTKGKVSFEPDMRFALEGKPWSFLFWFRYKALQNEKFSLRVGAHPALNFRTISITRNGRTEDILESRRYVATEVVPSYKLGKNTGIGMYYLHGQGFDEGVKQTNFVVLNSYFNNIGITKGFYLNVSPQTYYLRMDDKEGFYLVGFITLAKKDFPLSISSILNKAIDTQIVPEDDFTWNISLNYSFGDTNKKSRKKGLIYGESIK